MHYTRTSVYHIHYSEKQRDLPGYLQNFKADFVIVWKKIPLPLAGAVALSTCNKAYQQLPRKGLMIALHSGFKY